MMIVNEDKLLRRDDKRRLEKLQAHEPHSISIEKSTHKIFLMLNKSNLSDNLTTL